MSRLSIDFETRSTCELRTAGVYRYAEDPTTDIWCMAWAFDDEEPAIWTPADGILPLHICDHLHAGREVRAWNAQFERIIWREIMVKRYGAPPLALEQVVDTAAEAAAMALPRALDDAARVLGVSQQKDVKGKALMLRMTRPRKIEEDGTIVWWNEPKKLEQLYEYCKQDVRTERAIVPVLRRLDKHEQEIYLLDQRINDRGIHCDRPLVEAARRVAAVGVTRANQTLTELTFGEVTKVTNPVALRKWLNANGVATDSVDKAAMKELLDGELAPTVRRILEARSDAGRSSTAKLDAMLACMCGDDRLRGLLLYHGAGTGRWSGRLVQPHNMPRGEVPNVEAFVPDLLAEQYDLIDLFHHPVVVISSLLRGMLTAAPGHDLMAADFSAIEARVLNWLAGQDDVVENFRRYDAAPKAEKANFDPYRIMAVKMGRGSSPAEVSKEDRQAGKAAELGCGFGMGWKKFITAAWDVYQVRVNDEQSKAAVDIYRESHRRVKQLWYDTENACINAVRKPGKVFTFGALGNMKAVCAGAYLYVQLPSKRLLCYAAPSLEDALTPWGDMKLTLMYWGVDSYTHKWGKLKAYGGLLVENIVQAVARDLLAEGMLRAEAAGYPVVLSVHDEIVSEVPLGFGSLAAYEQIMATAPDWAAGCPITTEGWRGFRYKK